MGVTVVGRAGEKTYGTLTFPHPRLVDCSWSYVSIQSRTPGPTVCVSAGMHGSEYAGIEAALRLANDLEPSQVTGHVIVLPIVNPMAFWSRAAAVVPADGKNLSQVFPGRRDGTVTEVIAALLFDEIFSRCDALIDLHGGDVMERLTPFTIYQETGDADLDARSCALAASYGLPIAVRRSKEVLRRAVPGYMQAAAALRKIPGVVAEAGGEDQVRPGDVEVHLRGLRSALAHLGVLAGTPAPATTLRIVEFVLVRAPQDGLFSRLADVEARVRAGQAIGQLRDVWGRPLAAITAPTDGDVLFLSTSLAAQQGQLLFGLGAPVSTS